MNGLSPTLVARAFLRETGIPYIPAIDVIARSVGARQINPERQRLCEGFEIDPGINVEYNEILSRRSDGSFGLGKLSAKCLDS